MKSLYKIILSGAIVISILIVTIAFLSNVSIPVLQPQGQIAHKQLELLIIASSLMMIVVIPVFFMTFFFIWRYRASNKKSKYTPEFDHSKLAETIWWGVPVLILSVLATITWFSSHELDPYKPLASDKKPLTIQVIALEWKWLFLYPEQNIATINHIEFPEKTPINFVITADAPMSSFWIPSLGGQVYAMAGMTTKLHLEADGVGTYNGASANLSGQGHAGMKFTAASQTQANFERWTHKVKSERKILTTAEYKKIAQPSENNKATYYGQSNEKLYDKVVMKYMAPKNTSHTDKGSH